MRTITINRQKHVTLLADHRTDPITKVLLKVGDVVVACAGCKTVFLADVWRGGLNETCCVCGGSQTTDDIPNTENITFSKIQRKNNNNGGGTTAAPVTKVSYGGFATFCALVAIGLGIFAYKTYQNVEEEKEENIGLRNRIELLSNEYNTVNSKMLALQNEKEKLSERYTEQVRKVAAISMVGGIKSDDIVRYESEFGEPLSTEKVFFSVKEPILLKSVRVVSYSTGLLKLKIFNSQDIEVAEAYYSLAEGHNIIRFNDANLYTGRYYFKIAEGSSKLLYLKNFSSYPVSSNNLLDVTGVAGDYPETNFYLYFFDWEYTLQQ